MSSYLETFNSSLPTVQGKQVLSILQGKKDSGEITSVSEFKAQLASLTQRLLEDNLTPTIKVFLGKASEVIDSDTYNFILQRAKDDLDAGFQEFQTIEDVLDAHNQIVNQVVLKSIQIAINDIEERISLYELINAHPDGFSTGQFNTFSSAVSAPASRSSTLGALLYQNINPEDEAIVDTIGERLTLGYQNNSYLTIQGVEQWFDNETSASEVDVSFPDSKIQNIIDGNDNTFWIYNTLLSIPKSTGVVYKIQLDLAAVQDLNFIEIEPASPHPISLAQILYVGRDGSSVDTNITPLTISKPTKINLGKLTADKVILKFIQYNYIETQFEAHNIDTNFYDLLSQNSTPGVELAPVSDHLRDVLTSDFQLDGLLGVPRNPDAVPQYKLYQYIAGFDNIRVGYSQYASKSSFVGSALSTNSPGMVTLRSLETRPSDVNRPCGSIEYEVVKENFDAKDKFISAQRFPILPSGLADITHERLVLTNKVSSSSINNAGTLRFFPDLTITPSVYRNGTLLADPSSLSPEWLYESSLTQAVALANTKMTKGIKVLQPTVTDIYTVSYRPLIGNTQQLPTSGTFALGSNLLILNNLGEASKIRLVKDNVVITDQDLLAGQVSRANYYLIITLHRNTAQEFLSPTVEEYALLVGTKEKDKFQSDLHE